MMNRTGYMHSSLFASESNKKLILTYATLWYIKSWQKVARLCFHSPFIPFKDLMIDFTLAVTMTSFECCNRIDGGEEWKQLLTIENANDFTIIRPF